MEAYFDPKVQAFTRYLEIPGEEPAIVYLAGLGLSSVGVYLEAAIQPVLSEHHFLLVDFPGAGFSDHPENFSYSIEDYATNLSGLLDQIGSRKIVLVGHSMGGAVAIELAAMRPDLISGLVLAEANVDAGGGILSQRIAKQDESEFIDHGFHELMNNIRIAAMDGDYYSASTLGMWQIASPLAFHRSAVSLVKGTKPVMWDKLVKMEIPRSFIFGGRSLEEYEEDRDLRKRLENHGINIEVVPDAGHGMMVENPVSFARAVKDSLLRTR